MNAILLFTIATIVNVSLSTIRAIATIKGGKMFSATMNALCYGFYPLIVMLTAKDTVSIVANMIITAIVNFVCVWVIKLVEEKGRKDKMWKVEMAVPVDETDLIHNYLVRENIPHNYVYVGSWSMFHCYCETQADTRTMVEICKRVGGKISAYESQNLGV